MRIADWPEEERPRERLLTLGPAALSEAELLAIFLRTGIAGKSAVELGRELLGRFGSLYRLFAAPLDDVASVRGLGPAKYAQLQAVVEMARRALAEQMRERDAMSSPQAVKEYLRLSLSSRQHEVFVVMFLDAQNRLLGCEELFRGTLDANQRISAGGREDGAALQRRRRHLRAQSSVRRCGAKPR